MNLLDDLANLGECFISDLTYQNSLYQLKFLLLKFPIEAYSLEDWNRALSYLFHKDNFTSYLEIFEFLNQ